METLVFSVVWDLGTIAAGCYRTDDASEASGRSFFSKSFSELSLRSKSSSRRVNGAWREWDIRVAMSRHAVAKHCRGAARLPPGLSTAVAASPRGEMERQ